MRAILNAAAAAQSYVDHGFPYLTMVHAGYILATSGVSEGSAAMTTAEPARRIAVAGVVEPVRSVGVSPDSTCTCPARRLPAEVQFGMRFGAHALTCPAYRRSRDPLDADHDAQTRHGLDAIQPDHTPAQALEAVRRALAVYR